MNKLFAALIISVVTLNLSYADSGTCAPCDDEWTVERGWAAFGDVLLVRPLGTAATIGGFGLFAVASPFAAMADSTDEVFNTLVKAPADYTFDRELGELNK